MIRKLQVKLIAISMLSLILVLITIMGLAGIFNYRRIILDADNILSVLAENQGTFPKPGKSPDDVPGRQPNLQSPETPYESRYFSTLISDTGSVLLVDTGKIAAIDTSTAIAYARTVLQEGKKTGFLQDYRYVVKSDDSAYRIIFLDCHNSLSSFRSSILVSCLVSLFGIVTVLCLILILSRRIVSPVAESYEKQKQFITDAGHEIKTPLTIIDADAEILEMELGNNEWLQDIQHQTHRLSELTKDLIYLSHLEEEQNRLQLIVFPFSDLVSETAQSFQALAKTQGKSFTCQVQPMLSLRGDEKSLRQLVSILLDNALKYSSPEGNILLSLEKQGKNLHLLVENTVDSIEENDLKHVFDRFYRTDKSRNSQTGGYGIGLSIAKAVVSAHKGKITATAPAKNSFCIHVILPVSN
jgi:signal transduction histidine kinase